MGSALAMWVFSWGAWISVMVWAVLNLRHIGEQLRRIADRIEHQ